MFTKLNVMIVRTNVMIFAFPVKWGVMFLENDIMFSKLDVMLFLLFRIFLKPRFSFVWLGFYCIIHYVKGHKGKICWRQILAAEGAEWCDKISYHITKLPKHNELCKGTFPLRCHFVNVWKGVLQKWHRKVSYFHSQRDVAILCLCGAIINGNTYKKLCV